jgi:hypothetical protein
LGKKSIYPLAIKKNKPSAQTLLVSSTQNQIYQKAAYVSHKVAKIHSEVEKMNSLTKQQIIEYFHRSYMAADGLWFMKVEEKHGFNAALKIDKEVWRVMPKIQARMLKSMLGKGEDENALLESLKAKLTLEGFKFKVEQKLDGFQFQITDCPWHNLMVKSGREEYSEKVGTTICNVEYSVWTSEFDEKMQFTFQTQKCKGSEHCTLNFTKT